jgi:two-component system, chemotaxis family, protein-glutamate methylesterase/glutaminase
VAEAALPLEQPQRDVVVVGASAGGVEALTTIVGGLPEDFRAAVCVALHLPQGATSALASILDRAGPLPARSARDGEPLQPGTVLVAPPDHHLILEPGPLPDHPRPEDQRAPALRGRALP